MTEKEWTELEKQADEDIEAGRVTRHKDVDEAVSFLEGLPTEKIEEKLNRLSNLQAQMDVINLKYDEVRNGVLTPEIKAELDDIEDGRRDAVDTLQGSLAELTTEIKADVIANGSSVKADHLHAIYNKGRTTWNSKLLAGYAVAHPEIMALRKVGNPTVSIRSI